jgi:hypothetical protein
MIEQAIQFIGENFGFVVVLWISATAWWLMKPSEED